MSRILEIIVCAMLLAGIAGAQAQVPVDIPMVNGDMESADPIVVSGSGNHNFTGGWVGGSQKDTILSAVEYSSTAHSGTQSIQIVVSGVDTNNIQSGGAAIFLGPIDISAYGYGTYTFTFYAKTAIQPVNTRPFWIYASPMDAADQTLNKDDVLTVMDNGGTQDTSGITNGFVKQSVTFTVHENTAGGNDVAKLRLSVQMGKEDNTYWVDDFTLEIEIEPVYKPLVPGHYMLTPTPGYVSSGDYDSWLNTTTTNGQPIWRGAQTKYFWNELEPTRDNYDFSLIEADIAKLQALGHGQKLIVQFQYKAFGSEITAVPDYIIDNPAAFGGGVYRAEKDDVLLYPVTWNAGVQDRIIAFMEAFAHRYETNAVVQAVVLNETADGATEEYINAQDVDLYTEDIYGDGLRNILVGTKKALSSTWVIQFANGPRGQLGKWATAARLYGVGWGGPDIRPYDEPFLVGSTNTPGVYAYYKNYWDFPSVDPLNNAVIKGGAVQASDYFYDKDTKTMPADLNDNFEMATTKLDIHQMYWRYNPGRRADIEALLKAKVEEYGPSGGLSTVIPGCYETFSNRYSLVEGPDGDDDNDGRANLAEFALAGNPIDPTDLGYTPDWGADAGMINFIHAQRTGAAYLLEQSDNLISNVWTNAVYTIVGSGRFTNDLNIVTNQFDSADSDQLFIRLRIEQE